MIDKNYLKVREVVLSKTSENVPVSEYISENVEELKNQSCTIIGGNMTNNAPVLQRYIVQNYDPFDFSCLLTGIML